MHEILQWDRALFLWLNNLGTPAWDKFWLAISEVAIWIPFYVILFIALFRYLKLRGFLFALAAIFLNVLLTDQGSVHLFKEVFHRFRPCHVDEILDKMRLVKEGCGGWYGFVSSHAANTFGLAVLISSILKHRISWLIYPMLLWAAMVSYSRIYLGVHYPLDIICGGLYGSLCGWGVFLIFKRLTVIENENS